MTIWSALSWLIFIIALVLYFVTPQKELATFTMIGCIAFNGLPKA